MVSFSSIWRPARLGPDHRQLLLLKTALCEVAVARDAWDRWNRLTSLDKATSAEVRLLGRAGARVAQFMPDDRVLARLRGAKRYTFTRTQVTLATVRPVLHALTQAGVRSMLIKGAARVAERPSAASERTLRDVDLLVAHEDLPRAYDVIEASGWTAKLENIWRQDGSLAERFATAHAIGLMPPRAGAVGSLDIHFFTTPMCRNVGDDDRLWGRSRSATLLGAKLSIPSPTDSVVIGLAHSMLHSKGQKTSDWALDVADAIDAGLVEWDTLLEEVSRRQIEAFVLPPLRLMSRELERPVPPSVLAQLGAQLSKPKRAEFHYLATGYYSHARNRRHVAAARAMAIARAVAGQSARGAVPLPIISESPSMAKSLNKGELAAMPLPPIAGREDVFLEITFRAGSHWGRSSLLVRCPGLILQVWRRDAPLSMLASLFRRRIVVALPAALVAGRRIGLVGVQAGSRNTIPELAVRWHAGPRSG